MDPSDLASTNASRFSLGSRFSPTAAGDDERRDKPRSAMLAKLGSASGAPDVA
ncbi:MAG: hypothetical protein Q8O67_25590 [Deltaproteobacteria bacterium]|nr:hypothetical protein [Deltaproteobacteria bacterium]